MNKAWRAAGRWIGIVMVLCFFMPFFGVSCAGQELITIKGTDMVWGGKPGGLLSEGMGQMGDMGGDDDKKDKGVENVDPQPLAIAAFACALIVASLAWVRKKNAVLAAGVAAVVGFGSLIGLYAQFGSKLKKEADAGLMAQQPKSEDPMEAGMQDMANDMGNAIKKDLPEIDAGARMGLWLTMVMFVVCGAFAFLGLKDPGPTPRQAVAGGPPMMGGYGPPPGGGYGPPPGGGYGPPPGGGYGPPSA